MSFVTALALGIAVFVAAPLLAHRLRRLRADERVFAAARLVPAAQPRARRRAKLEDRALFGVRALAVIALALLGASPLVQCSRLSLSRSSGASMAVAIVIDDSMSMRVKSGGRSRFARATEAANDLLVGARDGDAIGVVLAGSPVRVALAPTTDLSAASAVIASLRESDRGTDLEGALHIAETLLVSLPQVDKRIVVLSDLADGNADSAPLGEGSALPIWSPLTDITSNASDCGVLAADDIGGRVRVHLACGKGVSAAGRNLEVRLGDRVLGSAVAGSALDVDIDLQKDSSEGERTVRLLGGDAIASDDVVTVLVTGVGSIAVVAEASDETAVTGGPPVVEQALVALRTGLASRPLPAVPDQSADFSGVLGLVIDDPPGFTPEQRRALTAYLDGGGVVLLALGGRAAAAPLGATLEPVLTRASTWRETKIAGAAADAPTEFFGQAARSLVDLAATHRAVLAPEDIASFEVLVPWSDGAPLVARETLKRGEAFVTTLPFAIDASDLPLRPAFLALLDAFVTSAKAHAAPRRTEVGSTWTLTSSPSKVVGPSDAPVEVVREDHRVKIVPSLIGAYHLTLDGRDDLRVASPVARETDLRPRAIKSPTDIAHLGATQARVDISAQIALALLVLMFAEIALRVRIRTQRAVAA